MKLRRPQYIPITPYAPILKPYNIRNNIISDHKNSKKNDYLLNILGIKLDFDDILILGILFFLYTQNIDDKLLYIILFMLLLN